MSAFSLSNYVTVTKNNSHKYSLDDLVHICKRMNNGRRDFLFVNSLQGKHIHIEPQKIFSLYSELVAQIQKAIDKKEKLIVIGFAETATAISHYIAYSLPNCIYYMQTTRECVDNANLLVEFREEHSHATEQLLYGNIDVFSECDRIIFVDDEISTGNTLLNFIHELQKIGIHTKFSVASILNMQNDEWAKKFTRLNIDCFYIIRGKLKDINAKVNIGIPGLTVKYDEVSADTHPIVVTSHLANFWVERSGNTPIQLGMFEDQIFSFVQGTVGELLPKQNESVLVLGTEEFMFTPMVVAYMLHSKLGANVQFHATTRSPIEVSNLPSYAITSRYSITSCYDKYRHTFVYNLQKYDKVFIITDVVPNQNFVKDILSALAYVGCRVENIQIITFKEYPV